jgi:hypothetical protein
MIQEVTIATVALVALVLGVWQTLLLLKKFMWAQSKPNGIYFILRWLPFVTTTCCCLLLF